MANMTATGWMPSAVKVVQSYAGAGTKNGRENLVHIRLSSNNFPAAQNYPSNGVPAPAPSIVGLRRIDYIIPLGPFFSNESPVTLYNGAAANNGASDAGKCFIWGAYHPSFSASGVTSLSGGFSIRIIGGIPLVSGTADPSAGGVEPSFGNATAGPTAIVRGFMNELTTNIAASQLTPTGTGTQFLRTYAIFGEF